MQSLTTNYVDFYSPTGARLIHARIDDHGTHTAVTVAHTDLLDRTFRSEREADRYLAFLQAEVEAGTPMWQIEQRAGALTTAAAVFDQLADEVLANAETPASLDAYRQSFRTPATRTRVHCKPLTAAELDLIRSHVGGVVKTKPGQSWLMLRAIYRRIGGVATFKPGSKQIIASLTLSAEQLAVAA